MTLNEYLIVYNDYQKHMDDLMISMVKEIGRLRRKDQISQHMIKQLVQMNHSRKKAA